MNRSAADEARRIRAYFGDASWTWTPGRDVLVAERREIVEGLVASRERIESLTICDVGCGTGSDLVRWSALGVPGAHLFGTELNAEAARKAEASVPGSTVARVNDFSIPYPDRSFDVVTVSLVLSTVIDPAGRRALLTEIRRVARPDGIVAIYDFRVRKPWNANVRAVRRAELVDVLGPPTKEHRLAPLLPLLDVALRLPEPLRRVLIGLLPRTHRLWVWARA